MKNTYSTFDNTTNDYTFVFDGTYVIDINGITVVKFFKAGETIKISELVTDPPLINQQEIK